jgi:hypothetical protein
MDERKRLRRMAMIGGAAALAIGSLTAKHPSATLHIQTHDVADASPVRMRAAVDLGVMAVSVLITWSRATKSL